MLREGLLDLLQSTGIYHPDPYSLIMILVGAVLLYLGIRKGYEPLLLVPIGFGAILVNIPSGGMMEENGLLHYFYWGIESGVFPPLIFLGVGALTDFGPLLSDPRTLILGAAAQFGIFATLIGAVLLGFDISQASSIGIIGGADGPTAIYLTSKLSPNLLGPIAVAAYSYMALVPLIQPPIMRLLTTKEERSVVMPAGREVSRTVRILFPVVSTIMTTLLVPAATPLIGMLMLGNLFRECGVVERLSNASGNELVNIVTILLGLAVGAKLSAETFCRVETIKILILGLAAFSAGTAAGLILGKIMHRLTGGKVNPLIGAAGVSAVPMAARVVHREGQKANPDCYLLMNAMGPNVAGVIGSAVAAGVLLALVG